MKYSAFTQSKRFIWIWKFVVDISDHHINISSRDRLIFNMGIPILVRRHIYIETGPWPRHGLDWDGNKVVGDCYKVVRYLEHEGAPCVPTLATSKVCRLPASSVVMTCMTFNSVYQGLDQCTWAGGYFVKSLFNSMLVNKDFLTWLLIGWRLCCQPIRCQVWKPLLTNMDFNMEMS